MVTSFLDLTRSVDVIRFDIPLRHKEDRFLSIQITDLLAKEKPLSFMREYTFRSLRLAPLEEVLAYAEDPDDKGMRIWRIKNDEPGELLLPDPREVPIYMSVTNSKYWSNCVQLLTWHVPPEHGNYPYQPYVIWKKQSEGQRE